MEAAGDTDAAPGWHPDPWGRFEYRYFNGRQWTADVAAGGHRYVDPAVAAAAAGATGHPPASNGAAIASLTCGIIAVAIGWVPVVFAVGAVLAVLALVFGTAGLRRAGRVGRGRSTAIAGLIIGGLGVIVAGAGLAFTVAVYRAVERFERPAAHDVSAESCTVDDGLARLVGTLRNRSDQLADFTVVVEFERQSSGVRVATTRVRLDGVEPGGTTRFEASRPVTITEVDCRIAEVTGPLPFGIAPR